MLNKLRDVTFLPFRKSKGIETLLLDHFWKFAVENDLMV